MTLDDIPVVSSNFSIKETPSTRSVKSNLPVSSATIGTVYGSHSRSRVFNLTADPFFTTKVEP